MISRIASLHFAPTARAAQALRNEGLRSEFIVVTGNTVIDAQKWVCQRYQIQKKNGGRGHILVTMHRRENWGDDIDQACAAIGDIAREFPAVDVLFPVHLNPIVHEPVHRHLGGLPNVRLTPPLDYLAMQQALADACIVLTDSGGLQEEAPTFCAPLLVLRNETERPEVIDAGCGLLVGTDPQTIVQNVRRLLTDEMAYRSMQMAGNPFGDGTAAHQIAEHLRHMLNIQVKQIRAKRVSMWWLDIFTVYLYALKAVVVVLAIVIFISSMDDLFIDIVYWVRRIWRAFTIYARHKRMDYKTLYNMEEKPLAILIPAWQEHGVIGRMAELAATTLDYENYHIFVGTYPNDPQTFEEVEQVRVRFPNVHIVVCARPGPTSKADCLNNILDAIFQFEQQSGVKFSGFILHDAEDVLSKLELRLFNFLIDRKDLIQLPVYPLERPLLDFTGGHYQDEFAEMHGKDIVVREALVGQVPSAGVGTCFSRRAILALVTQGDGIAFDTQSLTEDYDIGFRLKQLGMMEIFVRFPVLDPEQLTDSSVQRRPGRSVREASVISVREYFPDTLAAAVRQKSRWITGIVIQGFRTLQWSKNAALNYFLWRDRKGVITNFVSFLATLVALQVIALWLYQNGCQTVINSCLSLRVTGGSQPCFSPIWFLCSIEWCSAYFS